MLNMPNLILLRILVIKVVKQFSQKKKFKNNDCTYNKWLMFMDRWSNVISFVLEGSTIISLPVGL